MKKIEATIAPHRLEEIRDALVNLGVEGMSVSESKSLRPRKHAAWYRGSEYVVWFTPRYRIEVVVGDDQVEDCIEAIRGCAHGDDEDAGTIVVLPMDEAIRIRTGERFAPAWRPAAPLALVAGGRGR
jgi:nitrogen regulatory protein P-II 1